MPNVHYTSHTELKCDFNVFSPQFAAVEVIVTSLLDGFHNDLIRFLRRKEVFVLVVCGAQFLLGIPCVLQVQCGI